MRLEALVTVDGAVVDRECQTLDTVFTHGERFHWRGDGGRRGRDLLSVFSLRATETIHAPPGGYRWFSLSFSDSVLPGSRSSDIIMSLTVRPSMVARTAHAFGCSVVVSQALGDCLGLALPVAAAANEQFKRARAEHGDEDFAAVFAASKK